MPMPAGSTDLTVGGVLADLRSLNDEDCSPAVRAILERLVEWWTGAGCPGGKKPSQEKVYSVYFRTSDNMFVGGNPQDPVNPHDLLVAAPGSTTTQKVIWGIDPDGGHTLITSGTSLILTLKVTKYTFDTVNFVSAVDADVTVTYASGTECA